MEIEGIVYRKLMTPGVGFAARPYSLIKMPPIPPNTTAIKMAANDISMCFRSRCKKKSPRSQNFSSQRGLPQRPRRRPKEGPHHPGPGRVQAHSLPRPTAPISQAQDKKYLSITSNKYSVTSGASEGIFPCWLSHLSQ